MVGLPCSGKTTLARELEREHAALRLTPDEWQIPLFGQDVDDPDHDRRHDTVEALLWGIAARTLALGVDVILDFGFWARVERDDFRARAAALGVGFRIHYLDVPEDVLLDRLRARNARLPEGSFRIPEAKLRKWVAWFQPPTPDELV